MDQSIVNLEVHPESLRLPGLSAQAGSADRLSELYSALASLSGIIGFEVISFLSLWSYKKLNNPYLLSLRIYTFEKNS